VQLALHGGEDYELLFTVPQRLVNQLRSAPGFAELSLIGRITSLRKLVLIYADGRKQPLKPRGWDPFREDA
jgi:thiamine-monophosphate kinase